MRRLAEAYNRLAHPCKTNIAAWRAAFPAATLRAGSAADAAFYSITSALGSKAGTATPPAPRARKRKAPAGLEGLEGLAPRTDHPAVPASTPIGDAADAGSADSAPARAGGATGTFTAAEDATYLALLHTHGAPKKKENSAAWEAFAEAFDYRSANSWPAHLGAFTRAAVGDDGGDATGPWRLKSQRA